MKRIEVLLPRPFDRGFDYLVPQGMDIAVGDYVRVPFGSKPMIGVVWGESNSEIPEHKCKYIAERFDHIPPMNDAMRRFVDWTAAYTLAPRGMVLKMTMPQAKDIMQPQLETLLRWNADAPIPSQPKRAAIAQWLMQHGASSRETLKREVGASDAMIRALVLSGGIETISRIAPPTAQQFKDQAAPLLNDSQQHAVQQLRQTIGRGFGVTLLDGVTGSGKTEVYFDWIEQQLEQPDSQILVMLPEIALTNQWVQRFEKRFGEAAVMWHSTVSPALRRKHWQAIAQGAARVVVGARSSLFLPYKNLCGIVIDEEHEPSYKQEEGVSYQARDMAVVRAKLENIPIILASATPSIETMRNVQLGKYQRISLDERFARPEGITLELIDLRTDKPEKGEWLSPTLKAAMKETLEHHHQVLLFLNRKGYAPLVLCRNCGYRFECLNCSAWMVQYKQSPRLQCHHCHTSMKLPDACPACREPDQLVACGPGVERIEEEVRGLFPSCNIHTVSGDDEHVEQAISDMIDGSADIIIGTQLLAKGHHFPKLALVGVVDADLGLAGGDLRACERTYQLLHQLAGRAGREVAGGRALLQTVQPDHPVMQALRAADRDGFLAAEMQQREAAGWPPYGRLAALLLDGANESQVQQAARMLVQQAPKISGLRVLGPAPAPLSRLRNQYRFRILVKAPLDVALQKTMREWLARVPVPTGVRLKVDVDPYQFL